MVANILQFLLKRSLLYFHYEVYGQIYCRSKTHLQVSYVPHSSLAIKCVITLQAKIALILHRHGLK